MYGIKIPQTTYSLFSKPPLPIKDSLFRSFSSSLTKIHPIFTQNLSHLSKYFPSFTPSNKQIISSLTNIGKKVLTGNKQTIQFLASTISTTALSLPFFLPHAKILISLSPLLASDVKALTDALKGKEKHYIKDLSLLLIRLVLFAGMFFAGSLKTLIILLSLQILTGIYLSVTSFSRKKFISMAIQILLTVISFKQFYLKWNALMIKNQNFPFVLSGHEKLFTLIQFSKKMSLLTTIFKEKVFSC